MLSPSSRDKKAGVSHNEPDDDPEFSVVPTPTGAVFFNAVRAAVGAQDKLDTTWEQDGVAMAYAPVQVEWAWHLLREAKRENFCARLAMYTVFTAVFTAIFHLARPVSAAFAAQDAILEHTVRERETHQWSFHDISSDAEWFHWVEMQLIPTVMDETFYNGDSRAATWGGRFSSTVASYNTQTVPLRFRQARVRDDSCSTASSSSELARPCWGEFSRGVQFKEGFGEGYGNRFLEGINPVGSYGTDGHVVDVPLDKDAALGVVQQMKEGLWINEQTRLVAVEASWYNANLDLSTYTRWQLEISPGGRFTPSVIIYSCRLDPYSTTLDMVRLVLEVIFVVMLLLYSVHKAYELRMACVGGFAKSFLLSPWNWLEWFNLFFYFWVVIWWVAFIAKDKAPYQAQSDETYGERPDLSRVARHFDFTANIAALNIVFSYLKVFKYLQIFSSVGILWGTLTAAASDTWPFVAVFLLFTCGFSFAGHWMFGLMMEEFRTLTASFATLFLTLLGGFPYDDMKHFAPLSGALFAIAWVVVMALILVSIFVAILAEWYQRVLSEHEVEEAKLAKKVGKGENFLAGMLTRLCSCCLGGSSSKPELERIKREVRVILRRSDLLRVDGVRDAFLEGRSLVAGDLAPHFSGDLNKAYEFVQAVQRVADAKGTRSVAEGVSFYADKEELVDEEQKQLKDLQLTVLRLEDHLRCLRHALVETKLAPLREGQAGEGYLLQRPEPPPVEASAEPVQSSIEAFLPGSIVEAAEEQQMLSEMAEKRAAAAKRRMSSAQDPRQPPSDTAVQAAQEAARLDYERGQQELKRALEEYQREANEEMTKLRMENAKEKAKSSELEHRLNWEFQRGSQEANELMNLRHELSIMRNNNQQLQNQNAELQRQLDRRKEAHLEDAKRTAADNGLVTEVPLRRLHG